MFGKSSDARFYVFLKGFIQTFTDYSRRFTGNFSRRFSEDSSKNYAGNSRSFVENSSKYSCKSYTFAETPLGVLPRIHLGLPSLTSHNFNRKFQKFYPDRIQHVYPGIRVILQQIQRRFLLRASRINY